MSIVYIIFPLVFIVLGLTIRKKYPKQARALFVAAIIIALLVFALTVILFISSKK